MKINIITAFPSFFDSTICSLLKKASDNNILNFNIIDIKKYGIGKYSKIDDSPFGGGAGLIMKPDVISSVLETSFQMKEYINFNNQFLIKKLRLFNNKNNNKVFILPTPRGIKFNQKIA